MSLKPLRPIETPSQKLEFWTDYAQKVMNYCVSISEESNPLFKRHQNTHIIIGVGIEKKIRRLLRAKRPNKKLKYSAYNNVGHDIDKVASEWNKYVRQDSILTYNKEYDVIIDHNDKGVALTKTPYSIILEIIRLRGHDPLRYVPEGYKHWMSDKDVDFLSKMKELESLDLGNVLDTLKSGDFSINPN